MGVEKKQPLRLEIPKTISKSVYEYLKKAIIAKEFELNQKLNEKEIAEIFQVSRTPVREAIAQLAAEGYLELAPHHGAVVKGISLKEIKEILEVLRALDVLGVELVMNNIGSEGLGKLKTIISGMIQCCQKKEYERYLNLNNNFHREMWSHIPNDFLKKNIDYCFTQFNRFDIILEFIFQHPDFIEKSLEEHEEILRGLKSKDKNRLKTVVLNHWVPKGP